jgi:hypothetical protein
MLLVYATASIMCSDRLYRALNLYVYMAIRVVPPHLHPTPPFVSIPHFSPPHIVLSPQSVSLELQGHLGFKNPQLTAAKRANGRLVADLDKVFVKWCLREGKTKKV